MSDTPTIPPQSQERQPGREHQMEPQPDFTPRYPGAGRLDGKIALISGGDSGIGRAVAVLFAREGASVAIVYREEGDDAEATASSVRAEGGECLTIAGDIGDEAFCFRAVEQIEERWGRIDVLVNNAAEQHPTEFGAIAAAQLERTFRTNVFGYFHLTQAALPVMPEGAAIVNTTSVTAYRGSSHLIDYASTRGAIVAFTRSLAGALVDRKIRVNGVAPGPVWTPLIPSSMGGDSIQSFGQKVPMQRPGQPNEIATCHLFLACDDGSYMTGQVLHPNGGEIVGG